MDLLEYLKLTFIHFNFAMICIIHKITVLLKNHLNYLKDSIFKCLLRSIIGFYCY